jgi:Gpi18-like mannosyltransferase
MCQLSFSWLGCGFRFQKLKFLFINMIKRNNSFCFAYIKSQSRFPGAEGWENIFYILSPSFREPAESIEFGGFMG